MNGNSIYQKSSYLKWVLRRGENSLEISTINKFNIPGPPSKIVLEYAP
jgi:hypothetical protein